MSSSDAATDPRDFALDVFCPADRRRGGSITQRGVDRSHRTPQRGAGEGASGVTMGSVEVVPGPGGQVATEVVGRRDHQWRRLRRRRPARRCSASVRSSS
ncbi:MAG: hypothetical protein WKF58_07465 [Ilumatobacteraceae bacterium]